MEKDKEKHLHWMENENEIVLINKRLKLYQMEFHDKKIPQFRIDIGLDSKNGPNRVTEQKKNFPIERTIPKKFSIVFFSDFQKFHRGNKSLTFYKN